MPRCAGKKARRQHDDATLFRATRTVQCHDPPRHDICTPRRASHTTLSGSPGPHCARAHDHAKRDLRLSTQALPSRQTPKTHPQEGAHCRHTHTASFGRRRSRRSARSDAAVAPITSVLAAARSVSCKQHACTRSRKRLIVVLQSTTSRFYLFLPPPSKEIIIACTRTLHPYYPYWD